MKLYKTGFNKTQAAFEYRMMNFTFDSNPVWVRIKGRK